MYDLFKECDIYHRHSSVGKNDIICMSLKGLAFYGQPKQLNKLNKLNRGDIQGAHTGEIRYSNYLKILQQIPSISHQYHQLYITHRRAQYFETNH